MLRLLWARVLRTDGRRRGKDRAVGAADGLWEVAAVYRDVWEGWMKQ